MTWKRWIHGLVAAALGSLSTLTITGVAGYYRGYLLDWDFWEPVIGTAVFNALFAVKLYMKQFPSPWTPTEPPPEK
jgi:hypothetical protein